MHISSTEAAIMIILACSALLCQLVYIPILERWDYAPRWTHITVVIGVFLIGMTMLVFCVLGIIPWLSFWLLVYSSIAWGIPIIRWYGRKMEHDTEQAEEYKNGATHDTARSTGQR
jgi:Na+/melibiose symporter-like transporter